MKLFQEGRKRKFPEILILRFMGHNINSGHMVLGIFASAGNKWHCVDGGGTMCIVIYWPKIYFWAGTTPLGVHLLTRICGALSGF